MTESEDELTGWMGVEHDDSVSVASLSDPPYCRNTTSTLTEAAGMAGGKRTRHAAVWRFSSDRFQAHHALQVSSQHTVMSR